MPLPANVPQCRHTKTNGIRCGSPSVRGHYFCYYHGQIHEHQRRHSCAEARELPLQFPPLEDAHSIQLALMEIGQAVLTDRISDKKAGLLLYMLQTASINVKRLEQDHTEELVRQDYPEAVEEMERLQRESARDPEEKRQETLTDVLLKGLGIHPGQPLPEPIPPDETPQWWEIEAGYKQPLPGQSYDPPQRKQQTQRTQSDTEQNPPRKIPDIQGMADRSNNKNKEKRGQNGKAKKAVNSVMKGVVKTVPHSTQFLA